MHRPTSNRFQAALSPGAGAARPARRLAPLAVGLLLSLSWQLALPANAADVAARLRYALCRGNVAASEISLTGGDYGLIVRLTRPAERELAMLARMNRGKTLEVVFADRVLLRTAFSNDLVGGVFFTRVGKLDDANVALLEFRNLLREGPCGPLALPDTD